MSFHHPTGPDFSFSISLTRLGISFSNLSLLLCCVWRFVFTSSISMISFMRPEVNRQIFPIKSSIHLRVRFVSNDWFHLRWAQFSWSPKTNKRRTRFCCYAKHRESRQECADLCSLLGKISNFSFLKLFSDALSSSLEAGNWTKHPIHAWSEVNHFSNLMADLEINQEIARMEKNA